MGTFLSLSKSTTSISLDISEIALLVFGVLLVVGLVGEYAESEKWKRYVKTFEMFVILGVAGELFADGGIFLFSSHLQTIAEQEIAEVTRRAGDAKDSAIKAADAATFAKAAADAAGIEAGKAQEQASRAEATVGRANNLATSAKSKADAISARLDTASQQLSQVEERVRVQGPRSKLLIDGEKEFVEALKRFKGQKVIMAACAPRQSPSQSGEEYTFELTLLNRLVEPRPRKRTGGRMDSADGRSVCVQGFWLEPGCLGYVQCARC
jgi:hypothetical protein